MTNLQQAAARERRAPILWWLGLTAALGGALTWMVFGKSPVGAVLLAALVVAAWVAPLAAFASLAAPRRARRAAPRPGEGSYNDWKKQARLLGRVLLYCEDNDLPASLRKIMRDAREDLGDTFGAHPLRDDIERVCGRVREGAIRELKRWFWLEYRSRVQELREDYEAALERGMDEDERLLALHAAVENAAAVMVRRCMPRMLERERRGCARDCAWLAVQGTAMGGVRHSPIELAGALVVEWCDFSEAWLPAQMLGRAVERLDRTYGPAEEWATPAKAAETGPAAKPAATNPAPEPAENYGKPVDGEENKKETRKRVRVRVRRGHRRHSRHYRGPSILDIVLSFAQWVRYSVRSWMLYR